MAGAALSIKLRCASWQQLATIYRRDLSRGSMFLKASTQPPIGTPVRIARRMNPPRSYFRFQVVPNLS